MDINHKIIMNEAKDYFFITLGLIMFSFGWAVFLLPYKIVTGGVTGISAIIFYATGIPIESSYLVINIALLIVALKILGFKFMMKTIYAIFALSFFLWAMQKMVEKPDGGFIQLLGPGQDFMSLAIGTGITGCSLAIVFLHNGSTGGTDIIAAVINKFHNFSIGQALIALDIIIIGSCLFIPTFGETIIERSTRLVFGFLAMAIECTVLDYVMNARRESVQFMIFSKKWQEIANAIGTKMDHGVTILDGHGWYTGHERKVLCILARKNESVMIFRLIKMIDPNAFVSQSSVIGVYGEGFDSIKVKVPKKIKQKKQLQNETDSSDKQQP
ncbi:MAG: YitT family protein [Prevotella sp.]|nr:YitT family protein [Prevotella sp.]